MKADPELVPVEDRAAVLLVAGLDPSGGAGLLQDAVVVRAFGLHPVSALTGIAVQNTTRFVRREAVEESLLREQLEAVARQGRRLRRGRRRDRGTPSWKEGGEAGDRERREAKPAGPGRDGRPAEQLQEGLQRLPRVQEIHGEILNKKRGQIYF